MEIFSTFNLWVRMKLKCAIDSLDALVKKYGIEWDMCAWHIIRTKLEEVEKTSDNSASKPCTGVPAGNIPYCPFHEPLVCGGPKYDTKCNLPSGVKCPRTA